MNANYCSHLLDSNQWLPRHQFTQLIVMALYRGTLPTELRRRKRGKQRARGDMRWVGRGRLLLPIESRLNRYLSGVAGLGRKTTSEIMLETACLTGIKADPNGGPINTRPINLCNLALRPSVRPRFTLLHSPTTFILRIILQRRCYWLVFLYFR